MPEVTNEEAQQNENSYFYAISKENGREELHVIPSYSPTFKKDVLAILSEKCSEQEKNSILQSFRMQAGGRLSESNKHKEIVRIEVPVSDWPNSMNEKGIFHWDYSAPNPTLPGKIDQYVFRKSTPRDVPKNVPTTGS